MGIPLEDLPFNKTLKFKWIIDKKLWQYLRDSLHFEKFNFQILTMALEGHNFKI